MLSLDAADGLSLAGGNMYEKMKMKLSKMGITLSREGKGYFVECGFDGVFCETLSEVREEFAHFLKD